MLKEKSVIQSVQTKQVNIETLRGGHFFGYTQ